MKIYAIGAELLHVEGRTARYDEANSHCTKCGECA